MNRIDTCDHTSRVVTNDVTRCLQCGAVQVGDGDWRSISLPKKPCCEGCAERKRKAIEKYQREKGCHECGKYHRPERHK